MPSPRVFVSSTCYDLKYIRENLKFFINDMGYESILSEDGDVFFDPEMHTHDACLSEVQTCQIFVLIIGGRFGGKYHNLDKSITNKEYEEAVKLKIPVFTLIERNVLSEHFVYQKNKLTDHADEIVYPSVDDTKIFAFIDQVRKNDQNNAIHPFGDYHDIEDYLKKQWASMVYRFLTNQIETKKVAELFEEINKATEKIEYYTKQVAFNTGNAHTKALLKCYDVMLGNDAISNIRVCWKIDVTPYMVIRIDNIDALCDNKIKVDNAEGSSISYGGPPYRCTKKRYDTLISSYAQLRTELLQILDDYSITKEDFLEKEKND